MNQNLSRITGLALLGLTLAGLGTPVLQASAATLTLPVVTDISNQATVDRKQKEQAVAPLAPTENGQTMIPLPEFPASPQPGTLITLPTVDVISDQKTVDQQTASQPTQPGTLITLPTVNVISDQKTVDQQTANQQPTHPGEPGTVTTPDNGGQTERPGILIPMPEWPATPDKPTTDGQTDQPDAGNHPDTNGQTDQPSTGGQSGQPGTSSQPGPGNLVPSPEMPTPEKPVAPSTPGGNQPAQPDTDTAHHQGERPGQSVTPAPDQPAKPQTDFDKPNPMPAPVPGLPTPAPLDKPNPMPLEIPETTADHHPNSGLTILTHETNLNKPVRVKAHQTWYHDMGLTQVDKKTTKNNAKQQWLAKEKIRVVFDGQVADYVLVSRTAHHLLGTKTEQHWIQVSHLQ